MQNDCFRKSGGFEETTNGYNAFGSLKSRSSLHRGRSRLHILYHIIECDELWCDVCSELLAEKFICGVKAQRNQPCSWKKNVAVSPSNIRFQCEKNKTKHTDTDSHTHTTNPTPGVLSPWLYSQMLETTSAFFGMEDEGTCWYINCVCTRFYYWMPMAAPTMHI